MSSPEFEKPKYVNTTDLPRVDIEAVEGTDYLDHCVAVILKEHTDVEVPNRIFGINLKALGNGANEGDIRLRLFQNGYRLTPHEWGGRRAIYIGYLVSMTETKITELSNKE